MQPRIADFGATKVTNKKTYISISKLHLMDFSQNEPGSHLEKFFNATTNVDLGFMEYEIYIVDIERNESEPDTFCEKSMKLSFEMKLYVFLTTSVAPKTTDRSCLEKLMRSDPCSFCEKSMKLSFEMKLYVFFITSATPKVAVCFVR